MSSGPTTLSDPSRRSADELREIAEEAGRRLSDASAQEIVAWAARTFGARFCVTSSMADAVLAHLVSRVVPGPDPSPQGGPRER